MDMGVDLVQADGQVPMGPSMVHLLGPGYLDTLGLLPSAAAAAASGLTTGFTPPLPDLADTGMHGTYPDHLLQLYLGGHAGPGVNGPGSAPGPPHTGDGVLRMRGVSPLPGTTVDNPLMSYVIGKVGQPMGDAWGAGVEPSSRACPDDQQQQQQQQLQDPRQLRCAGPASSSRTEGGDYDPRAFLDATDPGIDGPGTRSPPGAGSGMPSGREHSVVGTGLYDGMGGMGLVAAHFPPTPSKVGAGAPTAAQLSPSTRAARASPGGASRRPGAGEGAGAAARRAGPGGMTSGDKGSRSSQFRGVTKHRRSGRYEAHIWVKDLGRQVYLGGYECEEHAAEAYDIAALKCKGRRGCKTNFELGKYADLLGCIDRMTMEELVMAVRRQSQGFSRGSSSFRGVTRHPSGRWEARIGVPGSKHIYLGLFLEEREAAQAYDRALVRLRGRGAATNFALSDYKAEMADYHRMQARLLGADALYSEISSNPVLFERWVKGGCDAFPELGSSPSSHTQLHHIEGSSENLGGPTGLPAPAASESKPRHDLAALYTDVTTSSVRQL